MTSAAQQQEIRQSLKLSRLATPLTRKRSALFSGIWLRDGHACRLKPAGLRFRLDNLRSPLEWLKPGKSGCDLVILRTREAHHIQIAGDTGTGKSTLVRQIISQVGARQEVAIIFDPDREYIQEFFNEKRGDWVLNPKDDRCPYWPIGAEADDEAEATPIALGLFPDEPTRQQFSRLTRAQSSRICWPLQLVACRRELVSMW
jgi:hypothetical protein